MRAHAFVGGRHGRRADRRLYYFSGSLKLTLAQSVAGDAVKIQRWRGGSLLLTDNSDYGSGLRSSVDARANSKVASNPDIWLSNGSLAVAANGCLA